MELASDGMLGESSVRAGQGSQRETVKWLWVGQVTTVPVLHLMLFGRPGHILCPDFLTLSGVFLLWEERGQENSRRTG